MPKDAGGGRVAPLAPLPDGGATGGGIGGGSGGGTGAVGIAGGGNVGVTTGVELDEELDGWRLPRGQQHPATNATHETRRRCFT